MSLDSSFWTISFWELTRSFVVDTCMYPLEVIKVHQQKPGSHEKSHHIAWRLFNQNGYGVFYHGFRQEAGKILLKTFAWPIVVEMPRFLERWVVDPLMQQALTGVTIGTASAVISAPLESKRIDSIVKEKKSFSKYQGFVTHWKKLTAGWTVFLVAQKYLRSTYLTYTGQEKLTAVQLGAVGTSVALLVSLTSAPFDVANTQKMGHNVRLTLTKEAPRLLFRGFPLSAFIRVASSIASVVLIDYLNRKK